MFSHSLSKTSFFWRGGFCCHAFSSPTAESLLFVGELGHVHKLHILMESIASDSCRFFILKLASAAAYQQARQRSLWATPIHSSGPQPHEILAAAYQVFLFFRVSLFACFCIQY